MRTDILKDGKSERIRWVEKDKAFFTFAYEMRPKEVNVTQAILRVKYLLKGFSIMNDNIPIAQGCL